MITLAAMVATERSLQSQATPAEQRGRSVVKERAGEEAWD